MPVEMAIWRMTDDGPVPLSFSPVSLEKRLEDMILSDPSLVGLNLLVVGRQVATPHGTFVDLLAIDAEARLHVLELKRERTPRDVVAQVLDYGSWVAGLSLEETAEIFGRSNGDRNLDDAFAEHFGTALPDLFNSGHQLTIVATALDPASARIVEYLAEQFGVPINAVFFRHFKGGATEYLARTWLAAPDERARPRGRSRVRPWNGRDFYVVQGRADGETARWWLASTYGLLNAGGGPWYWKPLRNLEPGHRVFAYVGGAGYVGVGEVTGEMMRLRDAQVEVEHGRSEPLIDRPDLPEAFRARGMDPEDDDTEYVVPVDWIATRPLDSAYSETGLFTSQVTACKLRDQRTIEAVSRAFGVAEE